MSVLVSSSWSVRFGWLLGAAVLVALGGCTSEKARLEAIAKTATTSRVAAATALRNAFLAKQVTVNAALDLAHERVNPPATGAATPAPASAADIALAGAVLDFIEQVEPDIKDKILNDFFWIRVGTLAGNAAAAAEGLGDDQLAGSVVLAGPLTWQKDFYWRQCPAHDALASIVLFKTGKDKEALSRLNDRPELPDQVAEAKAMIEKEMKKRPRR